MKKIKLLGIMVTIALSIALFASTFSVYAKTSLTELLLSDTTAETKIKNATGFISNSPVEGKNSVYHELIGTDTSVMFEFSFPSRDVNSLVNSDKTYLTDNLAFTFWIWLDRKDFAEKAKPDSSVESLIADGQIELNASNGSNDNSEIHWSITDNADFYSKISIGKWNKVVLALKEGDNFKQFLASPTLEPSKLNYFRMYTVLKGARDFTSKILVSQLKVEKLEKEAEAMCVIAETKSYVGDLPSKDNLTLPPLNNGVGTENTAENPFNDPEINSTLPKNSDTKLVVFAVLSIVFTALAFFSIGGFVFTFIIRKKRKTAS